MTAGARSAKDGGHASHTAVALTGIVCCHVVSPDLKEAFLVSQADLHLHLQMNVQVLL